MSDPIASLQSDSGHVAEKIIAGIRKIVTKKMKLHFLEALFCGRLLIK